MSHPTPPYADADRMLVAVDAILNRYLLAGADGQPRPMRYNPVDYQTLKTIEAEPGIRATDIARALSLPPTTLQSALDRLVRMGLVEKADHPTDGRAKVYALSADGHAMRARILAQDRANMDEMLSALDASERRDFLDMLDRIGERLRG